MTTVATTLQERMVPSIPASEHTPIINYTLKSGHYASFAAMLHLSHSTTFVQETSLHEFHHYGKCIQKPKENRNAHPQ